MKESNAMFVHVKGEFSITGFGTLNGSLAFWTNTVLSTMAIGHVISETLPMNARKFATAKATTVSGNVQNSNLMRSCELKRHIRNSTATIQPVSSIFMSDNRMNRNSFRKFGTEEAGIALKGTFSVNIMNVLNKFFWHFETGWAVRTETEIRHSQRFFTIIETLNAFANHFPFRNGIG